MRHTLALITILFIILSRAGAQSLFDSFSESSGQGFKPGGFIRSGMYFNKPEISVGIPVCFTDISLNVEAGNGSSYKAFADLRYRYASEYNELINSPALREAWAAWYTSFTEIKAGKQIIKWSSMDFFRLQDVVGPRNDLFRSFDPPDKDLGNVMVNFSLSPINNVYIKALLIPTHKPSVLYTDFIETPDIVEIKEHSLSDCRELSYGIRTEFFLRNFSASISYFDGYNTLPGLSLDTISIESGNNGSLVSINKQSFKIKTLSAGIEFILGSSILRTEAIWSKPDENYRQNEHVMLPELKWALGFEHFFGDFQVLFEYSGKYITDYEKPVINPALPDESTFIDIGSIPPDQIYEYARLQIGSFNRLYFYQLNEYGHFTALRIAYDKELATFSPSVNILYNITADEYMVNPVLTINPSDNLEIIVGAEIYNGSGDSLFAMINDRLNSIYTGLRIDF